MNAPATREVVRELIGEVRALRRRVPTRCGGFHRNASGLQHDLERCLQRRWPLWIRDEELARLRDAAAELQATSADFASVAARLEAIDGRVRALRAEWAAPADSEVASWLERRCDGWSGLLSRLGQAQRPAELRAEESRLAELETEVHLSEEAVVLLAELGRAIARLPNEVAAAPLVAHLQGLRQRALAADAGAAWLGEARRFLAPLAKSSAAAVEQPAPHDNSHPPADDPIALVTQLQAWGLATGFFAEEVDALRRQVLEGTDDDGTSELTELLARLVAAANAERDTARQGLQTHLGSLETACGLQPEGARIQEQLDRLARQTVVDPAQHKEWVSELRRLRASFENLASALEGQIVNALAARLATAGAAIDGLWANEASAALLGIRDRLVGERQRLTEQQIWRDALPRLGDADRLLAELAALAGAIAEERAAGARLADRRDRLLEELHALDLAKLRPQERIELEECRHELAERAAALGDARQRRVALEPAVERGEAFLDRLRQAEQQAKALDATLRARFEEFQRADYGLGCAELIARVEALVFGVPADSLAWTAVEEQLVEAEALLDLLDRHGRRLAAAQLEDSLTRLRQALQGRLDAKLRGEIAELLRNLDAAGHHALPAPAWRRRAAGLCRRVRLPASPGGWR
jgi:hypothetical protein